MTIPERNIQVELYRFIQNVITKGFSYEDIEFKDVRFEQPNINGRPDLVIEASEKGKEKIPILIIETKRKVPYRDPKFDPFSKDVISQAEKYATYLGAPYFATCNGERFVLFETFRVGVPLPHRRLKDYKVSFDEGFIVRILTEVGKFRVGKGKWLPLDDLFVQRLRSFHRFIAPFVRRSLNEKLRKDTEFRKRYVRWLKSQLFEFSEKTNENMAEQAAYLLANKITFYKTLEAQIPDLPKLTKIEAEDTKEFSEGLRKYFDRVLEIDYQPIFQRSILAEIGLPLKLIHAINDFIEELGTYNLAKIKSDVLGRVYEDLIPAYERHKLGQYYTPPPIVELIVEICVNSPSDTVLDPACGSGSFLVKAYHSLWNLKKKENPFMTETVLHKEILDQLRGVDINPFPAQLAAINLAVRNLRVKSENISLVVSDFFKIKPAMPPLLSAFDVVVTNPPYTRQEEMEYKEEIRDIALTYTNGSRIDVDARAGIYAYFFTHSTKFLKNGGKMGYITSDTFLDVGYGEGLKKFFLDHFKILAILWYDVRAFERALVGTCISILEKEDLSEDNRKENVVKFIRIKKAMPAKQIMNIIETTDADFENEKVRVISIRQSKLHPKDKWGKYLRAPPIFLKIAQHKKMIRLGEIAKIRRGFTTGADDFFYFDKEKIKLWKIESRFLMPVITSPQGIGCEVKSEDIKKWVLMVHKDKEVLEKEKAKVLDYIKHGENIETRIRGGRRGGTIVKGYQNLSTLKSRRRWYDLGRREPASLLFARKIWERYTYTLNEAKTLAHQCFYEIHPHSNRNIITLAGILNSSVTAFLSELKGRFYGGGVLELTVYEAKDLPVLDPGKLSAQEKKNIEKHFVKLCEMQRKDDTQKEQEAQKELDDAMFDALGLSEKDRRQVYAGLRSLRQMRLQRKEVEVLVETPEKWKPPSKRKKESKFPTEPSKRLDLWIKNK